MAAHKLGVLLFCSLLLCELTLVFSHDLPRRRDSYNNNRRNNLGDRHRPRNEENRHQRRHENFNKEQDFDHWDNFDHPNNFKGHQNKGPRRNHKDHGRFDHHKEDRHFKAPHKPFHHPSPPQVIGPESGFKNDNRESFHRETVRYHVTSPRPIYQSPKKARNTFRSYSSSSSKHASHQSSFQSPVGHSFSPSFSRPQQSSRFNPGGFGNIKKHTKSISVSFHQPTGYNKGHYHSGEKAVSVKTHAKSGAYYQPGSTLHQAKGSSGHTFNTCGSAYKYKGFCKSKAAGHYAHPGSLDCYIQCDAWGSGYVRPCAPGTYWAHQGTGPAGFNACVSKKHGFKGKTATQAPKNNFAFQNHRYTAVTRYYEHDPYGHGHGQGYY